MWHINKLKLEWRKDGARAADRAGAQDVPNQGGGGGEEV